MANRYIKMCLPCSSPIYLSHVSFLTFVAAVPNKHVGNTATKHRGSPIWVFFLWWPEFVDIHITYFHGIVYRNASCSNSYIYCIPKSLLFLHKIIPRTTNRMITDTDDTATAMVEVSVVSGTGVFAWTLEDVVVLVLWKIVIWNQRYRFFLNKYKKIKWIFLSFIPALSDFFVIRPTVLNTFPYRQNWIS